MENTLGNSVVFPSLPSTEGGYSVSKQSGSNPRVESVASASLACLNDSPQPLSEREKEAGWWEGRPTELERSRNLIKLFCHLPGESEIPEKFLLWCGIAMVGATLSDKVWIKRGYKKMYPNLYTMLVGPSGVGKGESTGLLLKILHEVPEIDKFNGIVTGPYLVEYMNSGSRENGVTFMKHNKLFLIQPELTLGINRGEVAVNFLTLLTEIYGGGHQSIKKGTITGGGIALEDVCLNWLSGTNESWLKDSLTIDMVQGGAFARMIPVVLYGYEDKRIPEPIAAWDFTPISKHITERLRELRNLSGELYLSQEAQSTFNKWYMERSSPINHLMYPSWKRQPEVVLKVGMILALADRPSMIVDKHHILSAIVLSDEILIDAEYILNYITKIQNQGSYLVESLIREYKEIPHSKLLRLVYGRTKMTARSLREIIETLREAGVISERKGDQGGKIYQYKERVID